MEIAGPVFQNFRPTALWESRKFANAASRGWQVENHHLTAISAVISDLINSWRSLYKIINHVDQRPWEGPADTETMCHPEDSTLVPDMSLVLSVHGSCFVLFLLFVQVLKVHEEMELKDEVFRHTQKNFNCMHLLSIKFMFHELKDMNAEMWMSYFAGGRGGGDAVRICYLQKSRMNSMTFSSVNSAEITEKLVIEVWNRPNKRASSASKRGSEAQNRLLCLLMLIPGSFWKLMLRQSLPSSTK